MSNLNQHNDTPTSRWRRNRSSVNLLQQTAPPPAPPASKPAPKLERSASKMSLFNLFSRPKVEKARGHTEVGLAVPMEPPKPPPPPSPPKSALRPNPPPHVQQAHRIRPLSLRPNTNVKRLQTNWEAPPLFQAYPQALKYATVQACVFSPDVLLRTQSQRKQYDLARERMDSHRDLAATLENPEARKLEKNHRRLISNSVYNPQASHLTSKVYVLDTSSHVLQYAGDGPFDRLPEKVLKLGKESAAFACDLIPGKHWVLQISQSANEDGTVSIGPKHSLLSRLRLQSASVKREATSFLLVLESAEEMDSWMTAVRREIDSLGGMKVREETIRESSSTEDSSSEKHSQESNGVGHRYLVQRDPNRVSKIGPVDSPMQDSPKIVASDWEGDRSERAISISDSTSIYSSRQSIQRRSVEAPSIATTTVSHEQLQLDQLRERSRFSYMSATSAGTRNTSRNSSPAPQSPLKEGFSPADTPISVTSLRSYHMNPSSNTSIRRRSMQPLPVTNEDTSLSPDIQCVSPQRHSFYGPTSPTTAKADSEIPKQPTPAPVVVTPTSAFSLPAHNPRFSMQASRNGIRSSSAPPVRNGTISPPPRDPAPPPGRPDSTIGNLHSTTSLTPNTTRRMSQGPKPFLRLPVNVRPQNSDGSVVVPRRFSSMGPAPAPNSLNTMVTRSVTTPARPPSTISTINTSSRPPSATPSYAPLADIQPRSQSSQQLRRPTSVQIRSNPAPFLSSSRPLGGPVRAISSTPSFVPGKRASAMPSVRPSPSFPALGQQTQTQAQRGVVPRRSMPVMALPPPAPPPNIPLPPPPPVAPPRAMAV